MSDSTHSDILQEVLTLTGLRDPTQASQAKAYWEDEAVKTMLADDKINATAKNMSMLRFTLTALVGQEHESTLSTLIEAAVERFLQTREDAMEARLSSLAWEQGYAPWTIRADPLIQILGTERALTDTKIQNLSSVSTLEKGGTPEKVDELEFEIKLRLSDRYAQSRRELQDTIIWLREHGQSVFTGTYIWDEAAKSRMQSTFRGLESARGFLHRGLSECNNKENTTMVYNGFEKDPAKWKDMLDHLEALASKVSFFEKMPFGVSFLSAQLRTVGSTLNLSRDDYEWLQDNAETIVNGSLAAAIEAKSTPPSVHNSPACRVDQALREFEVKLQQTRTIDTGKIPNKDATLRMLVPHRERMTRLLAACDSALSDLEQ